MKQINSLINKTLLHTQPHASTATAQEVAAFEFAHLLAMGRLRVLPAARLLR